MTTSQPPHQAVHPRGIWVAPGADPRIEAAVTRGGGQLVPLDQARGVIAHRGGPETIDELGPHIEWLQLPAAGIDNWISAGLLSNERVNTNASPAYADTVAEHVMLLILAALRNSKATMRATAWQSVEITPFADSTVAIVGAGRIGRAVIRRLQGFDVTVTASNRSGRPVAGTIRSVAAGDEHELLADADVVVIAAPATAATRHLVDAAFLKAMKPTATLVNVARGSLVDTEALVEALDTGSIACAALDVTEPEPLPTGHVLWNHPRAIVTPHIANTIGTSTPSLALLVEENVRRFLAGEKLRGVVDPELGY